jgi:hypothetical protein
MAAGRRTSGGLPIGRVLDAAVTRSKLEARSERGKTKSGERRATKSRYFADHRRAQSGLPHIEVSAQSPPPVVCSKWRAASREPFARHPWRRPGRRP